MILIGVIRNRLQICLIIVNLIELPSIPPKIIKTAFPMISNNLFFHIS